jgi:hypothetical protein
LYDKKTAELFFSVSRRLIEKKKNESSINVLLAQKVRLNKIVTTPSEANKIGSENNKIDHTENGEEVRHGKVERRPLVEVASQSGFSSVVKLHEESDVILWQLVL